MYKKLVSSLYVINIISQAIFTMLIPIGLGVLICYLLTTYAATKPWIWAVVIPIAAISGIASMVKFILTAMSSLQRLENQHNSQENTNKSGHNNE